MMSQFSGPVPGPIERKIGLVETEENANLPSESVGRLVSPDGHKESLTPAACSHKGTRPKVYSLDTR